MAKILFVITASDHWTLADGTRQPAGFWAEEAIGPYQVFKEAGYEIAAATPTVCRRPPTPSASPPSSTAARKAPSACAPPYARPPSWRSRCASRTWKSTTTWPSSTPAAGVRWRTCPTTPPPAGCSTTGSPPASPVSLVCHGPAALLATIGPDGSSPFSGYRLTGLSNAEEKQNGLADRAKWLLQDRLVSDLKADYREAAPFTRHVQIDRTLYTGQNPNSAVPSPKNSSKHSADGLTQARS